MFLCPRWVYPQWSSGTGGRRYEMEHRTGELRSLNRTGGDASWLCLCECSGRAPRASNHDCFPVQPGTGCLRITNYEFRLLLYAHTRKTRYPIEYRVALPKHALRICGCFLSNGGRRMSRSPNSVRHVKCRAKRAESI